MKQGFTLIELLVVVLIIGILASVALPQYKKAVEKSRATQALTLLKSVAQAEEAFFMANNHYTNSLDELDIKIPWKGKEAFATNWLSKISNDDWSLQTNLGYKYTVSAEVIGAIRLRGPYKGAGFTYVMDNDFNISLDKNLYCVERSGSGIVFEGTSGDYCAKIFKGKYVRSLVSSRLYRMP